MPSQRRSCRHQSAEFGQSCNDILLTGELRVNAATQDRPKAYLSIQQLRAVVMEKRLQDGGANFTEV